MPPQSYFHDEVRISLLNPLYFSPTFSETDSNDSQGDFTFSGNRSDSFSSEGETKDDLESQHKLGFGHWLSTKTSRVQYRLLAQSSKLPSVKTRKRKWILLVVLVLGLYALFYKFKTPSYIGPLKSEFDGYNLTIPTIPRPSHPHTDSDVLPYEFYHDRVPQNVAFTLPPQHALRQLSPVLSQIPLVETSDCLEQWVAQGSLCDRLESAYTNSESTKIDILYSWVNGSDWRHESVKWMYGYRPAGRWQEYVQEDLFTPNSQSATLENRGSHGQIAKDSSSQSNIEAAKHSSIQSDTEALSSAQTQQDGPKLVARGALTNRFRDHQELRYSLRSAKKFFHPLRTLHIVSPDFSAPYQDQNGRHFSSRSESNNAIEKRDKMPFPLNIFGLMEGFKGLPSQLRKVQRIRADRFWTQDGQLREGQVPQWLATGEALVDQKNILVTIESDLVLSGQTAEAHKLTKSQRNAPIRLHHDWNSFKSNWLISPTDKSYASLDYKREVLPTFNSMAIEGMMGDEPGLSDDFLYSNDDFFFTDDVSTSDFFSPLYGPVFQLNPTLSVEGKENPPTVRGEWSALWWTNYLLDLRFGQRSRPYIAHVHKSLSKPLLLEYRMMWAEAHNQAGQMRFRDQGKNIVSHYLMYHTTIERHREALLWSFFVLKLDTDGNGIISGSEWTSALKEMGVKDLKPRTTNASPPSNSGKRTFQTWPDSEATDPYSESMLQEDVLVDVFMPNRETLLDDRVNKQLSQAGWPVPLKTEYAFVSQDGYPFTDLKPDARKALNQAAAAALAPRSGESRSRGAGPWPIYHPTNQTKKFFQDHPQRTPVCTIDISFCFIDKFPYSSQASHKWEDVFKYFAFDLTECGDCLITYLTGQSGKSGLNAFLPPKDKLVVYDDSKASAIKGKKRKGIPHLPLSNVWQSQAPSFSDATLSPPQLERPCFTSSCVMANSRWPSGSSAHRFAVQLIQRYSYVIGSTPISFRMLKDRRVAPQEFASLNASLQHPTALSILKDKSKDPSWTDSQQLINTQRPALTCLNDDIPDTSNQKVGAMLEDWMKNTFDEKAAWEAD